MTNRRIVLVVEDEALIRLDAVDALEEAGFEVVEAADAAEAIRILESRDDICLVYTDIQMPGDTDGLALAALIRNRWPPVELIVTSGRFRAADVDLPERGVFLPKPVRAAKLIETVHAFSA